MIVKPLSLTPHGKLVMDYSNKVSHFLSENVYLRALRFLLALLSIAVALLDESGAGQHVHVLCSTLLKGPGCETLMS